jgi:MYND finger
MECANCGAADADKKCGKCYVTNYCSRECQQAHWKAHKKRCGKLANEAQKNKDSEGAPSLDTTRRTGAHHYVCRRSHCLVVRMLYSSVSTRLSSQQASVVQWARNISIDAGHAATKVIDASGAELQVTPAAVTETTVKDTTGAARPSETAEDSHKLEISASNGQTLDGNGESKATAEGAEKSAASAAQQVMPVQGIPSKPYQVPAGLSDLGRKIYAELKSVLDGPADKVGETLLETPFCESTGH